MRLEISGFRSSAEHQASCCCGQLRLTFQGDITRSSICHCFACQKRTGSAFGLQARVDRERVCVEGEAAVYERIGDAGGRVTYRFCPRCGTTVYWEIDSLPGAIVIAAGTLADPDFPAPAFSVYRTRKHRWFELPSSIREDWE